MGLSWLGLGPVGPIPMGLGLLGLVGPSPMGLSLLGLVGPSPMGLSLMGLVLVGLISTGRISCRTWPPAPWAPLWASILRPAPRGTSPAERGPVAPPHPSGRSCRRWRQSSVAFGGL